MNRFTIKTLLLVVAVIGVGFWFFDSGFRRIYQEQLSDKNLLTIKVRRPLGSDAYEVRVTYHYPPGFLYAVNEFSAKKPTNGWRFQSVRDETAGLICIYDQNDLGWIWIYSKTDEDLWESLPSRTGSWYATDRSVWEKRFADLRKSFPEIPYRQLPD